MRCQRPIYLVQSLDKYSLFITIDVFTFMEMHQNGFPWGWSGVFIGVTLLQLLVADRALARRTF